jgi:methionyl-tRNA formyltransferase
LRVAFLGSPPFATEVFAALVKGGVEVVGLVTAPPRLAGRGRKQAPNPLADLAKEHGIPVLRPESARDPEFKQSFAEWHADVGVVASYGQILDAEFLAMPRCGCLNLHGSLLPRWRGASPIQAALLAGDLETGVSVQRMVLALDAGNVIAEKRITIAARETAPQLFDRLVAAGSSLILEVMQAGMAADGFPAGKPQDPSSVTVCKRIHKSEGLLDWSVSVVDIDRRVRAMAGWPCAQTFLPDGTPLKVHRGDLRKDLQTDLPGTVISLEGGIEIAGVDGSFVITELQRQGKARLAAKDYLRGAKLAVGERLGVKA